MNFQEEEENAVHIPDLRLSQHWFVLRQQDKGAKQAAANAADSVQSQRTNDYLTDVADWTAAADNSRAALMAAVKEHNMAPFYAVVCDQLGWQRDEAVYQAAAEANAKTLRELEDRITDAEENLGESEVVQALKERAHHFCRIGDRGPAVAALDQLLGKTVGVGSKVDVALCLVRLGLFWSDDALTERAVKQAHQLLSQGGDWDRRNRLRDHEAAHLLKRRDFAGAARLLLDTLSTFNSYELFSFRDFIKYTVLAGVLALSRVDLHAKLLHAPEVLAVLGDLADQQGLPLGPFMRSLYDCDYKLFFQSLAVVAKTIARDQYCGPHARFYCRELRVAAYAQKLQSYRSVQLQVMADDFGVSVDFLDRELSRFIAIDRLPAKIDKVAMVIETSREHTKAIQYSSVIKQGDALLTNIQNLSRVIKA